jgi:anthranilate synthase component 1
MHIVSNVEGQLRRDRDALDALVAGFPAGTVSGAPKIRAMEIIDELEPDGRGPYGGCIGYLGADGEMDTCIVLRTAVVKGGRMHVQAGAGIVHDSDPAAEARECANKAIGACSGSAEEAVRSRRSKDAGSSRRHSGTGAQRRTQNLRPGERPRMARGAQSWVSGSAARPGMTV